MTGSQEHEGHGVGTVSLDFEGRVAIVTFDRPPVNALTDPMYEMLIDAFERIASPDPGRPHTVVLRSTGSRAFCAGADINYFGLRHADDPAWQDRHAALVRKVLESVYRCPVPVIAAVQSICVGIGLVIAASCDTVIAAESATFGLPEIDVGVIGGAGHVRRLVPEGMARYMALTGERIGAREFMAAGGVQRVVPDSEVQSEALRVASLISSKSPVAVRALKAALNHIEVGGLDVLEAYRYEQLVSASISNHPFSQEAAAAFLEKRRPHFDQA